MKLHRWHVGAKDLAVVADMGMLIQRVNQKVGAASPICENDV